MKLYTVVVHNLQMCMKSRLGGFALTRYMDGQGDSYIPPKLCLRGVKKGFNNTSKYTFGPGEIKHYDHLFNIYFYSVRKYDKFS
jgi:hypothetical protein